MNDTGTIDIYNVYQAMFYIKNNVKPIDFKVSERDGKNVAFIFNKEETKEVFKLWMDKKPKVYRNMDKEN
jgi:hypothetical protein